MIRRLASIVAIAAALLATGSGMAAAGSAEEPAPIEIVEVRGPIDQRVIDFLIGAIEDSEASVLVLQVDSPGFSSGDPRPLLDLIAEPPVPVVAWVGPRPAVATGGLVQLLNRTARTGAAPGVEIGYWDRRVAGSVRAGELLPGDEPAAVAATADLLDDDALIVTGPVPGVVDVVEPTLGQFIVGLDGMEVDYAGGTRLLDTAEEVVTDDGVTGLVAATDVIFSEPDLFTRFLRLAATPEAAFFFLVVAFAAGVFEFYAAGAGVGAAVAAVALFLAGYGIATQPVVPWAVALTVIGLLGYTADFQRNRLGIGSLAGTLFLLAGGFWFTDARPLFAPKAWAVVATVVGAALFFSFALGTVVRARFSTRTIGREHLVGRLGVAESGFDPFGVVEVDGARWRARAPRAAGLGPGVPIEVVEVQGILLEVMPVGDVSGERPDGDAASGATVPGHSATESGD